MTRKFIIAIVASVIVLAIIVGGSVLLVHTPDTVQISVAQVEGNVAQTTSTQIFDKTDQTHVSQILSNITGLIQVSGEVSCPSVSLPATYYHYKLVFRHFGIVTEIATGDSVGCQLLTVSYLNGFLGGFQQRYIAIRTDGSSFWQDLHTIDGAPASPVV